MSRFIRHPSNFKDIPDQFLHHTADITLGTEQETYQFHPPENTGFLMEIWRNPPKYKQTRIIHQMK